MSIEATENDRLAIDGGTPLVTDLPERGLIGAEERAAVLGVVDRAIAAGGAIEYGGPEEEAYCAEFAATLGGGYADAVNSGTAALYVALRALGVEPFTEVVVPAITDPGGIMPVPLLGCIPVVADTSPGSFNCGPEEIEAVMGPLTSAIVVAHIAGEPARTADIARLAKRHGVPLIEDCAQAHGARIAGAPVGSFGTVAAFSTMWGKHHSTGGQGGVLFTRDAELYRRIRGAADRGKPFGDTLPAGRNYLASLNFNQDELSAAIGRAQLAKLPAAVQRRRTFVRALATPPNGGAFGAGTADARRSGAVLVVPAAALPPGERLGTRSGSAPRSPPRGWRSIPPTPRCRPPTPGSASGRCSGSGADFPGRRPSTKATRTASSRARTPTWRSPST